MGRREYSFLRFYLLWAAPHTTVLASDHRSPDRLETRLSFPPSSIDHRKEQWDGYCPAQRICVNLREKKQERKSSRERFS